MTQALTRRALPCDAWWQAGLLCAICEEAPWTQRAQYCQALVCADCAKGEPSPEAETRTTRDHCVSVGGEQEDPERPRLKPSSLTGASC